MLSLSTAYNTTAGGRRRAIWTPRRPIRVYGCAAYAQEGEGAGSPAATWTQFWTDGTRLWDDSNQSFALSRTHTFPPRDPVFLLKGGYFHWLITILCLPTLSLGSIAAPHAYP